MSWNPGRGGCRVGGGLSKETQTRSTEQEQERNQTIERTQTTPCTCVTAFPHRAYTSPDARSRPPACCRHRRMHPHCQSCGGAARPPAPSPRWRPLAATHALPQNTHTASAGDTHRGGRVTTATAQRGAPSGGGRRTRRPTPARSARRRWLPPAVRGRHSQAALRPSAARARTHAPARLKVLLRWLFLDLKAATAKHTLYPALRILCRRGRLSRPHDVEEHICKLVLLACSPKCYQIAASGALCRLCHRLIDLLPPSPLTRLYRDGTWLGQDPGGAVVLMSHVVRWQGTVRVL